MIEKKEMWLTRSNSLALDDWNESKKFGQDAVHRRTYIGCFTHHSGESAAMWGLYCLPDARQIRISISSEAMKMWVEYLRSAKDKIFVAETILGHKIDRNEKIEIADVEFTDLLYVSAKGRRVGEKLRDGLIRWNGLKSTNSFSATDVCSRICTAKMKDVEWEFEDESRLIVTAKREKECKTIRRIRIPLTDDLIAAMSFTLSPWLPEDEIYNYRALIRTTMRGSVGHELLGKRRPYIMPSTLSGALGKWACNRSGK